MSNKCNEESCMNCKHKSKDRNLCYKNMQNVKDIEDPERELCNDFSKIEK